MLRPQAAGLPLSRLNRYGLMGLMFLTTLAILAATTCAGPWQLPLTGPVLRPYVAPESPWGAGHRGIDLPASPGDPILSPTSGLVAFVGAIAGRPIVVIQDAAGLRATLEPALATVEMGAAVARGQRIATVGRGGHCDARCVHFGARRTGTRDYINPLRLTGCHPILKPAVRGTRHRSAGAPE